MPRMTHEVAYALGAMVCFGLTDFVYKRAASAGVPSHRFLMVQTWLYAPAITAYALATGALALGPAAWWGALIGAFVFTGLYQFSLSLRSGSISINAPIFRLSFTVTAALAVWLLDEPLGARKLAGLGLALAAVWLLLGAGDIAGEARRESRASLIQVLIATAAIGIANLLYKFGLRAGATPATLLVAQAASFLPLATGFSTLVDRAVRPSAAVWPYAAATAALFAVGFVLLVEGLASGQASVLVPIAQMGFVVTATLGFALHGERCTPRKAAGLAVALAALACLALS